TCEPVSKQSNAIPRDCSTWHAAMPDEPAPMTHTRSMSDDMPVSMPSRARLNSVEPLEHLYRDHAVAQRLVQGPRPVVEAEDVQTDLGPALLPYQLLGREHRRAAQPLAALGLVDGDVVDVRDVGPLRVRADP